MAKNNTKADIKEQIAHILLRHSNGLSENAIIQQVTATSNVSAIQTALKEMANISELQLENKKWQLTSVGRSIYSDQDDERPEPAVENEPEPAVEKEKEVEIQVIPAHRTPDGLLHASREAAETHMLKQKLLPRVDDFIQQLGHGNRQKGLIRHYIIHWEKFKRGMAA